MTAGFAARTIEAVAEDRRVPVAYGVSRDAYLAVREETDALVWQIAEMPAHQLQVVADYLHGLLNREPLRSGPTFEPPRVVLGLVLLALEHVVVRIGDDDDASLATNRPPGYAAAVREMARHTAAELVEGLDDVPSPVTAGDEPVEEVSPVDPGRPSPKEPDAPDWFS